MSNPTQLAEIKSSGTLANAPDVKVDFFSKNGFDLACRIAKAFSTADGVPAQFRAFNEKKERDGSIVLVENPAAIGNCLVAIEVSRAARTSMIGVMQNADMIQGKLRWSSKFQIAAINASGRFTPLKFKLTNLGRIKAKYKEKTTWNKELRRYNMVEHEVEIDNWECIAWAYELDANRRPTSEVVQSIPVTMQMAVEEGWYSKEGSKWQGSMRFQMLQYRAGTFFGSIYAPDIIMGMGRSSEEERDLIETVQQPDGTYAAVSTTLQELRTGNDVGTVPTDVDTSTGEIIDGAAEQTDPQDDALREVEQQSKPAPDSPAGDAGAPTFSDAAAAIKAGDFDLARDIARGLPEGQQKQIEASITNAQKLAEQPRQRRERGGLNLD